MAVDLNIKVVVVRKLSKLEFFWLGYDDFETFQGYGDNAVIDEELASEIMQLLSLTPKQVNNMGGFDSDEVCELLGEKLEHLEIVEEEIDEFDLDKSYVIERTVFLDTTDGKYWEFIHICPNQYLDMFDIWKGMDGNFICKEVFPREITKTIYE